VGVRILDKVLQRKKKENVILKHTYLKPPECVIKHTFKYFYYSRIHCFTWSRINIFPSSSAPENIINLLQFGVLPAIYLSQYPTNYFNTHQMYMYYSRFFYAATVSKTYIDDVFEGCSNKWTFPHTQQPIWPVHVQVTDIWIYIYYEILSKLLNWKLFDFFAR